MTTRERVDLAERTAQSIIADLRMLRYLVQDLGAVTTRNPCIGMVNEIRDELETVTAELAR